MKNAYHANGKYYELIKERQKFADKHPNVYSYLGVVDTIQEAYDKKQVAFESLDNAVTIAKMILDNYNLTEKTAVDVIDKLGKLYVAQGNHKEAIMMLENTISQINSNSPVVVNKLIYRYASVFLASGETQKAKEILCIGVKENEIPEVHFAKLKSLSDSKEKETFRHKIPMYHLLHKVYQITGENQQANLIIDRLKADNPSDRFAKKRN